MIVYGDPHFIETLGTLVLQLRARVAALSESTSELPDLDGLRTLLVFAGQVEQAASDMLPAPNWSEADYQLIAQMHEITAHAANAFYARWSSGGQADQPDVRLMLASMARALARVKGMEDVWLTVNVPEGFAFYTLYPDQYCVATQKWLDAHATVRLRRAYVVGIRSIGTTLAAVVTASLRAHGWQADSVTVRPTGHPFRRHADLHTVVIEPAARALVVDEGPGASGSSMAAVARALTSAGMPVEHLSFLPSHAADPGHAASDEVRAWWATIPRYVTHRNGLLFDGWPLPEALAASLTEWWDPDDPVIRIEDFGGGLWRHVVYSSTEDWPPVFTPFERPKYRCTTRNGTSILWRFAGVGVSERFGPEGTGANQREALLPLRQVAPSMTAAALARVAACAAAGYCMEPLSERYGFIATRWVRGTPLTRADAGLPVLADIGRYIVDMAWPPLTRDEAEAAIARLRNMLYWNTWEVLGEAAAEQTRQWSELVPIMIDHIDLTYGDGNLAPHTWLRTHDRRLVKVGGIGHANDHTVIGRQALAWDVAGVVIEWRLDPSSVAVFMAAFNAASGTALSLVTFTFYRMAYAAFRAGQASICAQAISDNPAEQARLWNAYADYRDQLAMLLNEKVEL